MDRNNTPDGLYIFDNKCRNKEETNDYANILKIGTKTVQGGALTYN